MNWKVRSKNSEQREVMNPKVPTPSHIMQLNHQVRQKVFLKQKEKSDIPNKGAPIRLSVDSVETLKATKDLDDILKVLKEEICQLRIFHTAKHKGKTNTFTNEQKWKEFRHALQQI